jgi:hypothetical protein
MKKIITLALFGAITITGYSVKAQSAFLPAKDTITNAETVDLSLRISGDYNVLTLWLDVIKLTGTTAGTAFVQGSLTGVNYVTIPGTDTLTLANASVSKAWVLKRSDFLFYRIRTVGTGTQSTSVAGLALFR